MSQLERHVVNRKAIFTLALASHLLLVVMVSCRDTLWLVGRDLTVAPMWAAKGARFAEPVVAAALARPLSRNHVVRRGMNTYLHLTGIESGYGFFAPNVPDAYKLVFELHYPDGTVEYEPAGLDEGESSLRFASLMDYVGRTASDQERQILVKLLTQAMWRGHPEAIKVRAILGSVAIAPPEEFRTGAGATYKFRAAYEFVRTEKPVQ